MRVVYDAGMLIAIARDDTQAWLQHRRRVQRGFVPVVTAPVVAQVSRSSRQVSLRRLLAYCETVDFEADDAHVVGELLARAGTSDVIDGHVAITASRLDAAIITSDVADLERLVQHTPNEVLVRPI